MIAGDAGRRVSGETPVSVIIPAYNAASTLGATVKSVLAQTHDRLEIFIVDDGSTDDTGAIASDLAAFDDRITVIRRENGGVARARNTALGRASGEFVAWLDADDLWHPTKIERQLNVLAAAPRPPAFVYTGYRLIDVADRVLPNLRTLVDVSGFTICQQIATNYFTNVSSIMVPTRLARQVGGHDPRLRDEGREGAEDLLMQLRLAALGPAACCRAALVGYRMHANNMSLGHFRAARSNLRAIELVAADMPELPDWVLRLGRARVVGYAGYCLATGNVSPALSLVAGLARQQPRETLAMSLRVVGLALRQALSRHGDPDPELGRPFPEADPLSAPWRDHMLLSPADGLRLAATDAAIRKDMDRLESAAVARGGPAGAVAT